MYKRVLLKLSGEALSSPEYAFDPTVLSKLADELKEVHALGVDLAIVVGGGNFVRGKMIEQMGVDRVQADYMGMLGTVINALAVQNALEQKEVPTRVQTAIEMQKIAEPFIQRRAIRHLEKGRIVIFAAGTGNPYFTTDTTAALRGAEIGAEVVLKATKVDGIYSADPMKDPNATFFKSITFDEAMKRDLKVMDATAFALCREQNLPIKVFNIRKKGSIARVCRGEDEGTLVYNP